MRAVVIAVVLGAMVIPAVAGAPGAVTVSGFQTPESVLHDPADDVYLVSNINGNPTATDNNGFISRLSPQGRVQDLRWIAGGSGGVTLNAPKGMAIAGDVLYVADITAVRLFDRRSGRARGSISIPGSTFLNDVAAGPDGTVYVTDSGLKPDFSPSGTDAVYRLAGGRAEPVAKSPELHTPNGVAVLREGVLVVVTFTPQGETYQLTAGGRKQAVRTLPAGQLDGVVVLPGGELLVSSWAASAIFRVGTTGQAEQVVRGVKAPADIGYDARRRRVLIPLFQDNQVRIQPLP